MKATTRKPRLEPEKPKPTKAERIQKLREYGFEIPKLQPLNNLQEKLAEAKQYEESQGEPCYVVWSVLMQRYLIHGGIMPLMGEWYTSDGIQHGPTHTE